MFQGNQIALGIPSTTSTSLCIGHSVIIQPRSPLEGGTAKPWPESLLSLGVLDFDELVEQNPVLLHEHPMHDEMNLLSCFSVHCLSRSEAYQVHLSLSVSLQLFSLGPIKLDARASWSLLIDSGLHFCQTLLMELLAVCHPFL